MSDQPKILIVDDQPRNLVALERLLRSVDATVISAGSGQEALQATLQHRFALALLDVQMPGMDGYELAEILLSDETTGQIPLIFLTAAYSDEQHCFKAYASGAVDYIVKPYEPSVLLGKVNVFLELGRHRYHLETLVERRTQTIQNLYELHRLAAKVSTELLNLPIDADISGEVESALKECLHPLGADRGYLFLLDETQSVPISRFEQAREGLVIDRAAFRFAQGGFPWVWSQMEAGSSVCLDSIDDMPSVALTERAALQEMDVLSLLVLPLRFGQRLKGILAFDAIVEPAHWPESAAKLLQLVGDALLSAIHRHEIVAVVRESEHRFRASFETLAVAAIGVDDERRVIYWNRHSEWLYGYSAEEAMGRALEDLIVPEHLREEAAFQMSLWIEGQTDMPAMELDRVDSRGSAVSVYSSQTSIRNHNGQREAFLLELDLRPQKHAEHERERLERQYLQAQKMEAVGQLAGGIAHDFNNLLTVIAGYADLLLKQSPRGDNRCRELDAIREATQRAQKLTKQLLTFSLQQNVDLQPQSINRVVGRAVSLYERLIPETIRVVFIPGEELPSVLVDSQQMDQVVANLIVNARDAILAHPDTSFPHAITLETGLRTRSVFSSGPTGTDGGDQVSYACLTVRDTGVGMDAATRSRIFEPFFTTKSEGKGTGLGLATVFGIMQQNQGYVDVESAPLEGTAFSLYWPAYAPEAEGSSEETATRRQPRKGEESILLVEDDPRVLHLARTGLQELGYRVLIANEATEALKQIDSTEEKPDVVVSDVVMPGMSGLQLRELVVEKYPDIKIILTSGYPEPALQALGMEPGSDTMLRKPYSLTELTQAIGSVLPRRSGAEGVGDGLENGSENPDVPIAQERTRELASLLPMEILYRLRIAASTGRLNELNGLVQELSVHQPELAARIDAKVQKIDYKGILHLLDSVDLDAPTKQDASDH